MEECERWIGREKGKETHGKVLDSELVDLPEEAILAGGLAHANDALVREEGEVHEEAVCIALDLKVLKEDLRGGRCMCV